MVLSEMIIFLKYDQPILQVNFTSHGETTTQHWVPEI